jgi:hypothetical protein
MGIILLLIAFLIGFFMVDRFLPLRNSVIRTCGGFLLGCVISGTSLYLLEIVLAAWLGPDASLIATLLLMIAAIIFLTINRTQFSRLKDDLFHLSKDKWLIVVCLCFLVFSGWLNYFTFHQDRAGDIRVFNGAWSDIMYHHAYVRTVAVGSNVPTEYPYFARAPIRYHFLFDYWAGKVAQLGLNSVHSLNLLSALSLFVLLVLVFEFGRVYFQSPVVGLLGGIFLLFHSSWAGMAWLVQNWGSDLIGGILGKTGWLSGAEFEGWGLFNLNVFINQRHFAFGLAVFLWLLTYFLDYGKDGRLLAPQTGFISGGRKERYFLAVFIGCLPFWNVIITAETLVCLFLIVLASFFNHRSRSYQLLMILLAACLLVIPQLFLFRNGESVLSGYPRIHFGYGLDHFTLLNFFGYYFKVLGLKWLLFWMVLLTVSRRRKVELLIVTAPFVIANLFQVGYILYDNNKLIISWLLVVNLFVAHWLVSFYQRMKQKMIPFIPLLLAGLIGFGLTFAGLLDFFSVMNTERVAIADNHSSFKKWLQKNTEPGAVFMTDSFIPYGDNAITAINLAGRMLYAVRNDVDSSCNLEHRLAVIQRIYSWDGSDQDLKALLSKEQIDFVLVDPLVSHNSDYHLNEWKLAQNLKLAYQRDGLTVYHASRD